MAVSSPRDNFTKMSSDRQRSDDESPSTSSGSSDADQRDPAAPEPEEQEERKPSATQQKKNTKLSSKTTAKLSTSAKRLRSWQGKFGEPKLDGTLGMFPFMSQIFFSEIDTSELNNASLHET
ncbi:Ubiquitin-conjugating enzyme E2 E3 [Tupaia chinensis]|uniref:Ubiquitin-conjugating enzyme E2 E3 n=1 Tax=Tupaia chinensis TaxID=246437 RepID=L9KL88_TUPCH|nr:Ubiquitin-conjugating enzyme E2 E3 [Tupaia chinensis]